ncbi:9532_t:CDS:2 [Funneliformis geosporum]|uniref:9532_t:CDS:1 n=1 Tax=Funneliformis geosporum TaxID=1117311 RepID=A0A9W4WRK5_9GLOM|nr:9532_t:CDS:2 [Funneliformis geosporum]
MARRNIQGAGNRKQRATGPCLFITLPPEMFINICQNLPPVDLLSLARACKRFNGFLSAEASMTTQEIWKASREMFLPYLQLPPPDGMTERQYVRLVLERGCQFCGKTKIRKVYWEFLVRCCEVCLKKKTLRKEDIKQDYFLNEKADDVLAGLAYIPSWHRRAWDRGTKNRPSSLYWTKDFLAANEEYQKVPHTLRIEWIRKKREEGDAKMKEAVKRKLETDKELRNKMLENTIKRNERASQIQSRIADMKSEKNEYGIAKYSETLMETQAYLNSTRYMNTKSPQPFTDRAWALLKKKLIKEYNELSEKKRQRRIEKEKHLPKDTIIQMRQFDIYEIAKQWIPDPETEKNMEKIEISAAELAFAAASTSTAVNASTSSASASTSTSADNTMTNEAPSIKSESTANLSQIKNENTTSSLSDFTHIKVENAASIPDITSDKIEDVTSTSNNASMNIDNLISTSEDTPMNIDNITSIPNMSLYFSMPNPISDFSYSNDNNTSYTDPMEDVDMEQFSLEYDMTTPSSSTDEYFMLYDPYYLPFDSNANINIQQDENRFNIEKYLPWCPSYRNPPFHEGNPYNLWDENYLMKTLMPQIWCEATYLLNNSGPTTTVQGAVLGGYRENDKFKCKDCVAKEHSYGFKISYSYRNVRKHLIETHSIRYINDEEMIDVLPEFNTSVTNDPVFNNDIKNKLFAIGFNFNLLDNLVKY